MAREIKRDQNYGEKLLRLIPSEIVAAYIVVTSVIPESAVKWGYLIVSIILFITVPCYMWRIQKVKNILQLIITTIAFAVWTYSLNGGAFKEWGLYKSWIASVILVLWTLIIPIIIPLKKANK